MSRHRFFLQGPLDRAVAGYAPLAPDDAHHAVHVLRLKPGEEIDLVEPHGGVWRARVIAANAEGVRVDSAEALEPVPIARVSLVQGIAKGDKMDAIVRQAVEVGAAAIVPVTTERSVVRLDARKRAERTERWRRVALAAAKQAKRDRVPEVEQPVALSAVLQRLADFDLVIVAWEEASATTVREAVLTVAERVENPSVAAIVGPEGGLCPEEVAALTSGGAVAVTLGPSILRAETAAVVVLALTLEALREAGSGCGD